MTSQPEATLASLAELFAMLEQAGLQFWLAGGWAVDFHAGRVTRPHTDVDLVVHHADKNELHALLLDAEFKVVDDSEPDAEMIYQSGDFKVDLSYIVELDDGTVVSPGWEHWPWPPSCFSSGIRQLSGVSCHVVSASTLLTSKRAYETQVGDLVFLNTPGSKDTITLNPHDEGLAGKSGGIEFRLKPGVNHDEAIETVETAGGRLIRRGEHAPGVPTHMSPTPTGTR